MSRAAKITLFTSVVFAGLAVWGVHAQQRKEQEASGLHNVMGVIRDEARQAAKKKQREQELLESMKKREIYERVQTVGPGSNTPIS
ncbi:cytochrome C oxidase assembly protein [Rhizoctonia solani]|uniref:Cytochrome C oxidase assembly protein n=1 Tax=Rhizoctonia solani TaxID=456999 RepID=A0A8H8NN38_9AGAM|nr:cytochrome C oxidase assembly protein [Rhizoctonia solani]QRW16759.1 cytochrome C oxidase assembly protein [Rhizoctonia solani]